MATSPEPTSQQVHTCHCGKSFTRIENLRRHERAHSRGNASRHSPLLGSVFSPLRCTNLFQIHACPHCSRSFARVDVLRRHIKVHESATTISATTNSRSTNTPPQLNPAATPTVSSTSSRHSVDAEEAASYRRPATPSSSAHVASSTNPNLGPLSPRRADGPIHHLPFPLNASYSLPDASGASSSGLTDAAMIPITNTIPAEPQWPFDMPQMGETRSRADDETTTMFGSVIDALQPISRPSQNVANTASTMPDDLGFLSFPSQLAWDDGFMWSTRDAEQFNEIDWSMFGISPQAGGIDVPLVEATMPRTPIGPSRPPSPPIDQTEEDQWPTNYQPKRPFMLGMSGHMAEVMTDPSSVPSLAQWSRFWLDSYAYDRVISSLAFASKLPGAQAFRMPSSLATVNTLISLYFERFLPQFPILHLATFQMASTPPLLVAAFMMIGACLSGLRGSRAFAVDLVEIMRRTIAERFELDSINLRNADLLHVSLLTSFAGLWSGHQRSFELAELSRGMLINLSRRTRLLENATYSDSPIFSAAKEPLQIRWQKWISAESKKRFGLAMFLFDSLFPTSLDMPSYLSQGEMIHTVLPSDDRYWLAPTASAWQAQLGVAPLPPAPYFSLGVAALLVPKYSKDSPEPIKYLNPFASLCLVNALHHHIWEFRSQLSVYLSLGVTVPFWARGDRSQPKGVENGFEGRKVWLEDALEAWEQEYYGLAGTDYLSQAGRGLFHLGFISLNTHLRELYAVSGKFGPERAQEVLPAVREWATYPSAVRAASHSLKLLQVFDITTPSANIYAPVSVFIATLCLWVFVSLRPPTVSLEAEDEKIMESLFGDRHAGSAVILKTGVRYLSGCKEWRIGSALALVLAKMMDQGPVA